MWTLVGAGLKNLDDSMKSMSHVMPRNVKWIKERAAKFDPKENLIHTDADRQVNILLTLLFHTMVVNYKLKSITWLIFNC